MLNSTVVSSTGSPSRVTVRVLIKSETSPDGNFVAFAIFFRGASGAAQDSADSCDQFSGIERLGKVVVGADLETHDAIDGVAASGEQQDGKLRGGAKLLEQFESRTARQHDIQNNEFVFAL